jgi:oxygen-independent coproporphyrinogen-3 oxidase
MQEAFLLARAVGFRNIGMDLIYGVPRQTMPRWAATLDKAIRYRPEHISAYSLSLDNGSLFKREAEAGRFALPDDDRTADMYEYAAATLARAGYGRYEISNFALPGFECRHNMNYWSRGEYLGIGPGAWSFLSGRRYHTIADTEEYARRLSSGNQRSLMRNSRAGAGISGNHF